MTALWGTRGDTYDADVHKWGYTPETLTVLLERVGFSHIDQCGRFNRWEFKIEAFK